MTTELRVSVLHKAFGGERVLRGIDLTVPGGSFTAILGPSGSGKTTLLRVIAGFERADRGTVVLGDRVVEDERTYVPPEQRHIGYVPQEGALFPHLSVEENVGFGLPRAARRGPRVHELLEMVGLGGVGRKYPHQLSGGQQQRVAVARALAVEPQLVLLDEPFSSLDAGLRASVRADVQAVLRQAGTTALLVTHDQDEALSMADRVALIRDGKIGQIDTPEGLYSRPADPLLAQLLGEANLVEGVMEGGAVRTAFGVLAVTAGLNGREPGRDWSDVVVLIRPEQLQLSTDTHNAPVTARVERYQYFGHDAVVEVRPVGEPDARPLVVRVVGGQPWPDGTEVGVAATGPVRAWPAVRVPHPSDAGAVVG